ncbi:hypothetical protein MGG_16968 [Pyricularia oryzae 70-15]|uniref:Uncharacterized protein n=3 Tax=Pyricularia oryzae TaxID=318829 RepID=G4N2G4_PYRO7|nr:uncharacterized protein MGG_16968 [Pyricularia oryzae 70-15]EHA53369.1 hypothetical protein MGG_16968 [Pyricularia oryzae 70-15]ELQ35711.1 hypothetical protein OOU_Y34scaffold00692g14 [Pyricularia oryzae Y34]KAI7918628.1 hypothetical protein M9X92_006803 [Pyricularia oryzae]KAI7920394.1 hypothetical protein M0657_006599 [Pyricularia oryzae]
MYGVSGVPHCRRREAIATNGEKFQRMVITLYCDHPKEPSARTSRSTSNPQMMQEQATNLMVEAKAVPLSTR